MNKADNFYKPKKEDLKEYRKVHSLSKSTYVKGKQCAKMLYLNKHKPKLKKAVSKQTEVLFTFGKKFETDFRSKFEESIHLTEVLGNQFHLYAGLTEELLETPEPKNIFEAGVFYNEVLVLTDVLQQNEDGSYIVYEVKYTNKLKPVVMWDLALQYYVCKNKLKNLQSFNVVMIGKKGKFKINNMTHLLEKQMESVAVEIEEYKKILKQEKAPEIKIGSQCFRPYKCQFFDYCRL
ncbi:MAG: Dna2/Cas4 domain-containing protein [Chitinophagales bacterium]